MLLSVGVAGCGAPREELGPVSGRLTLDGKPVTNAVVMFQDDARGIYMQAEVDEQGRFEVSMAAGYGLPLSTYAVSVRPSGKLPPEMQGPVAPSSFAKLPRLDRPDIPVRFRDTKTSGLTITVEGGGGEYSIKMNSKAGT